jgi:Prokaryotic RING finger family 1
MSAQSGKPPIARSDDAGRACPYCRFPLKEGAPIVRCEECQAAHHADCWEDNSGCAVVGCAGGPGSVGKAGAGPIVSQQGQPTSYSTDAPPPAFTGSPPSAPPAPDRGWLQAPRLALGLMLLAVAIAGAAVAVALSRQGGSAPASSRSTDSQGVSAQTLTTVRTVTVRAHSQAPTATNTPAPSPEEDARTQNLFAESGPSATGTDANGFNVGPGCSDDPASPLPGCNDSPSVPVGHPSGTCANGITIDSETTSCGLAENVYSAYTGDGPVTARSPERNRDYTFICKTAGPGTTGYTICLGKAGVGSLYLRWHS